MCAALSAPAACSLVCSERYPNRSVIAPSVRRAASVAGCVHGARSWAGTPAPRCDTHLPPNHMRAAAFSQPFAVDGLRSLRPHARRPPHARVAPPQWAHRTGLGLLRLHLCRPSALLRLAVCASPTGAPSLIVWLTVWPTVWLTGLQSCQTHSDQAAIKQQQCPSLQPPARPSPGVAGARSQAGTRLRLGDSGRRWAEARRASESGFQGQMLRVSCSGRGSYSRNEDWRRLGAGRCGGRRPVTRMRCSMYVQSGGHAAWTGAGGPA